MRTIGAFLRRDALVAISYRAPFVLEVFSTIALLITLSLFGRLVPDDAVPGGYFAFATVGIALLAFAQAGLGVVASNFRLEQVQGTLEVVLSAGVSTAGLAAGMAAYPMAFATGRVAVYAVVGAGMGAIGGEGNSGLALAAVGLAAVSFAGLGLIAAALVVTIRQAAGAVGLLVTLLALGGGVGFPRELLPGWASSLGTLSPLTHALDVARAALFRNASWESEAPGLAALLGLALASLGLGFATLVLALRRARRRGAVADY